jgi:hypothetical protein
VTFSYDDAQRLTGIDQGTGQSAAFAWGVSEILCKCVTLLSLFGGVDSVAKVDVQSVQDVFPPVHLTG